MAATQEETRLWALVDQFGQGKSKGRTNPGTVLRDIIEHSPPLREAMIEAVRLGNLEGFEPSKDRKVAGDYDPRDKCIYISTARLSEAANSPKQANAIRFTLGHEVEHALRLQDIIKQEDALTAGANAMIARGDAWRDYTGLLASYLEASARIEIDAEIAGFNRFAGYVKHRKPNATLGDLYEASEHNLRPYIRVDKSLGTGTYTAVDGLTIDADLRLEPTDENVATMRRCFFDANSYHRDELGRAFESLIELEKHRPPAADPSAPAPVLLVDCGRLGIAPQDLDALEAKFIDLRSWQPMREAEPEVDVGSPGGAQNKKRDRQEGELAGAFDLGESLAKRPKTSCSALGAPADSPVAATPDGERHPDHVFYRFLRMALPPEVPDNAVADAMRRAKEERIVDASHIGDAPGKSDGTKAVAFKDGTIWIGGDARTGFASVVMGLDEAWSMRDVAAHLEKQRAMSVTAVPGDPQPERTLHLQSQ